MAGLAYGTVTEERLELAGRVKELREGEGLLWREIAERLGISRSYAQGLYTDPDGSVSRARKDGYRLPCPRCGALMTGSDGRSGAPKHCASCTIEMQHEERFWTPERIIERFQEFHRVVGRTPTVTDVMVYNPTIRGRLSDERIAEAEDAIAQVRLPVAGTVREAFGSWRDAVLASGLEPAPSGGAGHRTANRRPGVRRSSAAPPGSASVNGRLFDDVDRLLEGLIR